MSTALIDAPTVIALDETPSWVELLKGLGNDSEPEFFWLSAEVDEVDDASLGLRTSSF